MRYILLIMKGNTIKNNLVEKIIIIIILKTFYFLPTYIIFFFKISFQTTFKKEKKWYIKLFKINTLSTSGTKNVIKMLK